MINHVKFFNNAVRLGFFDDVTYTDDGINIRSGKDHLSVKLNSNALLFWGNKNPFALYEYRGNKIESALIRLCSQYFSEPRDNLSLHFNKVYSSSIIYPETMKDGQVVFSDNRGKKWITNAANDPNVTLAFYDLLYGSKGECYIMELPQLAPKDDTTIQPTGFVSASFDRGVDAVMQEYDPYVIRSSFVPKDGFRVYGSSVISAQDGDSLDKISNSLDRFFTGHGSVVKSSKVRCSGLDNPDIINLKLSGSDIIADSKTSVDYGYVASSYRIYGDLTLLMSALNEYGITYSSLTSGVQVTGKEAVSIASNLKSKALSVTPIKSKAINRNVEEKVLSGVDLEKELEGWGLESKNNVFSSLKLVTMRV